MTDTTSLETKGAGGETARAFEEFLEAFDAFKDTNDQRLAEIERRGESDALTSEKLARIEEALDTTKRIADTVALKSLRPQLGNATTTNGDASSLAHKSAFDGYVRRGDAQRLVRLEEKALSVGTPGDGGYLVPPETEAAVNRALKAISPMRAISGVRQVSTSVYKCPFATSGVGTGWTAETASRTQTTTPALVELQFPTMELYAMPAASQTLLDDAIVNIDEWLADEVRLAFAEQEGTAFVTGDGTNKPKGFLAYTTVANGSWTPDKLGFVASGKAADFAEEDPGDALLDLVYAAKAPYRANGTFMMSRATVSAVRKLKDGQGNYLWQPATTPGEWASLIGYPVAESEDMPNIEAGSLSIAFGDFSRGYLIVDRAGIRVLRDPYSAKPYVLFYTTKRVGGGVQDFDAIKLLKFAA